MNLVCEALGGTVRPTPAREYGRPIAASSDPGEQSSCGASLTTVWMSHGGPGTTTPNASTTIPARPGRPDEANDPERRPSSSARAIDAGLRPSFDPSGRTAYARPLIARNSSIASPGPGRLRSGVT